MVDKLTILTSIHVIAATLWVGSGFALNVMITRAFSSSGADRQLFALQTTEFVGQRLLTPLALVVVGGGIWLAAEYYSWDLFWINYGLAGFVLTFCVGFFFLGPRSGKVAAAIEGEAGEEQVRALSTPLIWVARLDLLFLLSIIAIMVIKPA